MMRRRRELRYWSAGVSRLMGELRDRAGGRLRSYGVVTVYLAPDDGKAHGDRIRWRMRQYDGKGDWWFETKEDRGEVMVKHRRNVGPRPRLRGYRPLYAVSYRRTEYEQEGLRVTVD